MSWCLHLGDSQSGKDGRLEDLSQLTLVRENVAYSRGTPSHTLESQHLSNRFDCYSSPITVSKWNTLTDIVHTNANMTPVTWVVTCSGWSHTTFPFNSLTLRYQYTRFRSLRPIEYMFRIRFYTERQSVRFPKIAVLQSG